MLGVIKANEIIGKSVEDYVAEKVHAEVISTRDSPFDISNETALIEVKSCFYTVKDHKYKGIQKFQRGRFFIYVGSHDSLKPEAMCQGKIPLYYFVLKGKNETGGWTPLEEKSLDWDFVDKLVEFARVNGNISHRKSGVAHIKVWCTAIFPQTRLQNEPIAFNKT